MKNRKIKLTMRDLKRIARRNSKVKKVKRVTKMTSKAYPTMEYRTRRKAQRIQILIILQQLTLYWTGPPRIKIA